MVVIVFSNKSLIFIILNICTIVQLHNVLKNGVSGSLLEYAIFFILILEKCHLTERSIQKSCGTHLIHTVHQKVLF